MVESVIVFGGDEKPRRTIFRDLGRDRRLPLLAAGLGAVAAFGSLASEWQSTAVKYANVVSTEGETLSEDRVLTAGLMLLGPMGAGYLAGLLLLAVAVVLTLAGPAPGRAYARVAGFAVGGVLLALLLSLVYQLSDSSLQLTDPLGFAEMSGVEVLRISHGRGLWCALAAVGLGLAALGMSARSAPAGPEPPVVEADDALEMTITPTTPFASHPGELDQPHRS
ncbi:hypothetical protein [Actinoplanes philippinensis]|uniref:hypothetical protein n=1 Tax=Actinoplanes philippinensis TaxID=35752 RepID=UPI0033C5BDBD